jgi:mxaJ protein
MRFSERAAKALILLCGLGLGAASADAEPRRELRVCADPNNLPYSDERGGGFENQVARLLASDLGAELRYTWWAQRRGALRNTLKAGLCDVVIGVPTSLDSLATTKPYYTSSYVFLSKASRGLDIRSFDDPRLRQLRVGVQLVGDDYANTPPVHALSRRGISDNVRGYSVLGDYANEIPAASIVKALEQDEIDIALVWGPLAGYFARDRARGLRLIATPDRDGPLPMHFAIGMGTRHQERELRAKLETFIVRRQGELRSLLERYGVPLQ